MTHLTYRPFLALFALLIALSGNNAVVAQNGAIESLDVYLDCGRRTCDFDYIRREIAYVNWMRERTTAHVHLLITSERTGSSGQSYKLNFIGLREFAAVSDTLLFTSSGTDTSDERRQGLTRKIEAGLVRYVSRTTIADRMDITVARMSEEEEQATISPITDPWNSWYFGVGLSGDFRAEESSDRLSSRLNLSANRTTEEMKVSLSVRGNYSERNFDIGDETITSISESGWVFARFVNSIGKKWSAGVTSFTDTSTSENREFSSRLAPAIEYSIYPYSESDQRSITFFYELGYQTVRYKEVTIFDKSSEQLLKQELGVELDFRQPWGSASGDVRANSYLTDFEESRLKYYSVEIRGSVNLRIVRGLGVNFGFSYELVKDQLYLPKEELTEEEILLGVKRLPTSYEYELQMGFTYNFGSIYNNVVNSRLNIF